MGDATGTAATIRPREAAHFGAQAARWWDPKGPSAMLHRLNPVRLRFLRDAVDRHWGADVRARQPLTGRRALDVGCGAGLLCEPLARLGAAVTGVDAAAENIAVARAHAATMGFSSPSPSGEGVRARGLSQRDLSTDRPHPNPSPGSAAVPEGQREGLSGSIDYRCGELAALGLGQFDLVVCMEVLEHVADKPAFIAGLARHLVPGGLLILSTPNRTLASRALLVGAAEWVGAVPRGTHDWHDFVTPDELATLLAHAGLVATELRGIGVSPFKGLHLSADLSLDLILAARHA